MKEGMDRIIECKRQARRKAAALPIEEKLRILDQLREELLVGLAEHRRGTLAGSNEPNNLRANE